MKDLEYTYKSRKEEITKFIQMLKFLEIKELERNESGITGFDSIFRSGKNGIDLSYQELINILKSNVSLMLYNIIEFTVSNLVDAIYDAINFNNLSYVDVNDSIKELWKYSVLKVVNDPNANFKTFTKKNDEIISYILDNKTLKLKARNTLPVGNLNIERIEQTFDRHGVSMDHAVHGKITVVFDNVKQKRNDLAHGSVSFIDAVSNDALSDIESNTTIVTDYLENLIATVKKYLGDDKYRNTQKV